MIDAEQIVWTLATLCVSLLVWVVAIGAAIVRWRVHPKVSALVTGSAAIVIVFETISTAIRLFVHPYLWSRLDDFSSQEISMIFSLEALVVNMACALAYAMLFYAIFLDREPAS